MSEKVVTTRLFTLERVLCLARPVDNPGTHRDCVPAVLTIPRGGRPHEPRLVLFGDHGAHGAFRLGTPLLTDSHVVACCDDRFAVDRRELADVLTLTDSAFRFPFRVRGRLRRRLDRYPGCSLAVARRRDGHLAVARDGSMVATRSSSGTDGVWAPICGSFLYCWLVAGLTLAELPRVALVVGRLTAAHDTGPGRLETVGRVHVTAVPASRARRLAS